MISKSRPMVMSHLTRSLGWAWVLVCICVCPQQQVVEDKDKKWCPGREDCISCSLLYTAKLKSVAMEDLMTTNYPPEPCALVYVPSCSIISGNCALSCQGRRVYLSCALENGEKNCLEMTFKTLLSCAKDLLGSETTLRSWCQGNWVVLSDAGADFPVILVK